LGVVEHRAKPGVSMGSMRATAYVTEDYIKDIA
jgi:predicted methyltransferase